MPVPVIVGKIITFITANKGKSAVVGANAWTILGHYGNPQEGVPLVPRLILNNSIGAIGAIKMSAIGGAITNQAAGSLGGAIIGYGGGFGISDIFFPGMLNPLSPIFRWLNIHSGIPYDPLVLDLNRDGQINLQNATFFDFDANGFHELAAWIDKGDAFLVLDKNFNGIIDNGSEMFGDAMILPDGSRALSGFHALSAFDSNGDGRIDINDDIFSSLKLLTGAGYLVSLADAGIKSITLPPTASVRRQKNLSLSFYGGRRWTIHAEALSGELC